MGTTIHHRCGHDVTVDYEETEENVAKLEITDCLTCFKQNDPEGYAAMQRDMVKWIDRQYGEKRD